MFLAISRWLILGSCLGLSACAGMLSWDEPPRRSHARVVKAVPRAPEPGPSLAAVPRVAGAGEYVVKPGDTLYSIAFRNQADFRELARLNDIGSGYRIEPGQILKLRAGEGRTVTASVTKADVAKPAIIESTERKFDWLWPTTGKIDREYAPQSGFKGLDFTGNVGQPVFAAAPGRVVYSGNALKGYGELIIIKHSDVFLSAYGYNRKRHVVEGDVVTSGQPIAELGLGPESKPLLHFEIRERGQPVNPARYLPKRETVPGVAVKD